MLGVVLQELASMKWPMEQILELWERTIRTSVETFVNDVEKLRKTVVEEVNAVITPTTGDGQYQHCTPWPTMTVDKFLKRIDLDMILPGDSREFRKKKEQSGIGE